MDLDFSSGTDLIFSFSYMRELGPVSYYPFLQGATPESLMPAISTGIRTEFHGTGSTSMMPLGRGGVVDNHLRVYGTRNLRIVDAGIFPMVPAAHLQAPVYAVAEKVKWRYILEFLADFNRQQISSKQTTLARIRQFVRAGSRVSKTPQQLHRKAVHR